jgi:hypothetical protein
MIRYPRRAISRRALFQTLGISAALSPFIPLLNASGQEAKRPKRLLLVFTPDGSADSDTSAGPIDWKPAGTETDFTLNQIQAPLQPLASKLVVPWGLKMSAKGAGEQHAYGSAGMWTGALLKDPGNGADFDGGNGHRTGWGSGPSVDQIVAAAAGPNMPYAVAADAATQETPYRTVELGVQCGNPTSVTRTIYKADDQPLHPETNPQAAFDRLFANFTPPPTDPAAIQAAADAAAQKKKEQTSILDLVTGDLNRLRTRVSSEEYAKVDAHLAGIRALEQRLDTTMPVVMAGCTVPTRPDASGKYANNANFPTETAAMLGLIPHLFACDLTRVASVQLSCGFSNVTHTWLGHDTPHHTMSHEDVDNRDKLMAIDNWYASQLLTMLQAMDAIDEGNGTLLDNTLVVWGRELGTTSHAMQPWPTVLIGGAQGALRTGRFLDVNKEPAAKLLVSVLQMMGMDGVTTIGNVDADSGPLTQLA